jgi:hypothetical protein
VATFQLPASNCGVFCQALPQIISSPMFVRFEMAWTLGAVQRCSVSAYVLFSPKDILFSKRTVKPWEVSNYRQTCHKLLKVSTSYTTICCINKYDTLSSQSENKIRVGRGWKHVFGYLGIVAGVWKRGSDPPQNGNLVLFLLCVAGVR